MPLENFESPSKSLTPAQHAAINKIRELSLVIFGNHPEIAQDYRDGLTNREIAIKHNIDRENDVGIRVATEAVRLAIKALIPDKGEVARIAQEHVRTNGLKVRDQRKGIHGMSANEKSAVSRRNGISTLANKSGFYALSREELIVASKMGKILSGKGGFPWDALKDPETGLTEGEYCDRLMRNPQYQVFHAGKTTARFTKIAQLLNEKFHDWKIVRTRSSIAKRKERYHVTVVAQTDPETGLTEEEYCDVLIRNPQYQFFSGGKMKIQCIQIAKLLNEKFHDGKPVRTSQGISERIMKSKATL